MKALNTNLIAVLISFGLVFTGCEAVKNSNNTQRGGVIGAAAGAGIGAAVAKNNRALGAIIGGVVGGATGAIIGNKMDKQAREIEQTVPGAEVVRVEEGIQVILDEEADIRFEYDKSDLTAEAQANLDNLATVFLNNPDTNILVVGHTDSRGSDSYNQTLSEQRAASVVSFLSSKGVASSRLTTTGVGETQPREDNETDAGRAANRRVEFAITANEEMIEEAQQEAGE